MINCEINLILTWSEVCILISGSIDNQLPKFIITDIKLYVPVVTSLPQENVRLLDQLKSGFKRKINWNRYQSKVSIQAQNQYLDYLVDPSFQGVNRLSVLSFQNNAHWASYKQFSANCNNKNYSVMLDGKNFLNQLVKKWSKSIWYHQKSCDRSMKIIIQRAVYCIMFISKVIIRW